MSILQKQCQLWKLYFFLQITNALIPGMKSPIMQSLLSTMLQTYFPTDALAVLFPIIKFATELTE